MITVNGEGSIYKPIIYLISSKATLFWAYKSLDNFLRNLISFKRINKQPLKKSDNIRKTKYEFQNSVINVKMIISKNIFEP